MIFFTSDTHFADPRVLRIDRRPFLNMAEHDAALIQTWNDVIGEDDDVWHLGDFMSVRGGDCDDLLMRLHGRKHLIVGNNDPETTTSASGWTSVQHYRELEVDGLHLISAITRFERGIRWVRNPSICTAIRTASSSRFHASSMSGLMPRG